MLIVDQFIQVVSGEQIRSNFLDKADLFLQMVLCELQQHDVAGQDPTK